MSQEVAGVYIDLGLNTDKWVDQLGKVTEDISRKFSGISSQFSKQMSSMATKIITDTGKQFSDINEKFARNMSGMGSSAAKSINKQFSITGNNIDKQMTGIGNNVTKKTSGMFTTIAGKLPAVLGTAAIGAFVKSCVDMGSDITEVQNVVDTAFGNMSTQADEFAKSSMERFGLSELSAKKYMGVFGQMSSAMGVTGKDALEMAENVTALTGDVASFYNLGTDEAYTKMKSIWTGETETLKDLGVVMTQTNLDQYALNNGFGKTTANMTEQEKVMLRYQYVTNALSNASGDFAKTQDSWANQTRILTLRFEQLKASLGKGFIALFTPIVKAANVALAALQKLADGFASFISMLTGADLSASTGSIAESAAELAGVSDSIGDVGDSATGTASDVAGIGDAAAESAKKIERSLAGFDQINKITDNSDDGSSDSGGGSSGGGGSGSGAAKSATNAANEISKAADSLTGFKKLVDELADKFKTGFKEGLGKDFDASIERSKGHIESIKNSLIDIFTDTKVTASARKMADSIALSLGKLFGSVTSIGMTVGENLLGGFDNYLSKDSDYIKNKLVNIFDVNAELADTLGDWYMFLADVAEVFRSDDAKAITGDIAGIFLNGFFEVTEICGKLSTDILGLITKPFIENKDAIKQAMADTLEPVRKIFDELEQSFTELCIHFSTMYDEHIKPMFDRLTEGLSKLVGAVVDVYDKYIVPILDRLSERAVKLINEDLQPMAEAIADCIGKAADLIGDLWHNVLEPLFEWLATNVLPVLTPALETIGNIVLDVYGVISKVITGIIEIFSGVIDFLDGVFTGDWKRCLDGLVEILKGIIKSIWSVVEGIVNIIIDLVSGFVDQIIEFMKRCWNGICDAFSNAAEWFTDIFNKAWDGIKGAFDSTADFFGGIWDGIKNTFSNVTDWFRDKFSEAWQAVRDVFSSGGEVFSGIKDGILSGLKDVVNGLIGGINDVVAIPFNGLNSALDKLRGLSILGAEPFGWLPSISVPSIPMLAQGGYVKANTPQLAMIGDNRHQGEVVAPEDKLKAMALEAAQMSSGGALMAEAISILKQILKILENLDLDIQIDGMSLKKYIVDKINKNTKATGKCEIIT